MVVEIILQAFFYVLFRVSEGLYLLDYFFLNLNIIVLMTDILIRLSFPVPLPWGLYFFLLFLFFLLRCFLVFALVIGVLVVHPVVEVLVVELLVLAI